MSEQSVPTSFHCTLCNDEHQFPGEPTCHEYDRRRISRLEVAVQRIEAKERAQREADVVPLAARWSTCGEPGCDMEAGHEGMHSVERRAEALAQALGARPTPPGVFPPMGTHPAVGVATVDGKATCPKCPESIGSRATYARVPEHPAPSPAMAAISKWSTSHPLPHVGAGCWCRMGSACPGHETQGPTPAEAAIFERGGFVRVHPDASVCQRWDCVVCSGVPNPAPAAMLVEGTACERVGHVNGEWFRKAEEFGRLAHVGTGCWCKMGEACPDLVRQRAEANRRNAAAREHMAKREASTPAAMLREAAGLLEQAMDAMQAAGDFDGGGLALGKVQNAKDIVMLAQRDAEARESLCPSCAKAETRPDFCMACATKRGTAPEVVGRGGCECECHAAHPEFHCLACAAKWEGRG